MADGRSLLYGVGCTRVGKGPLPRGRYRSARRAVPSRTGLATPCSTVKGRAVMRFSAGLLGGYEPQLGQVYPEGRMMANTRGQAAVDGLRRRCYTRRTNGGGS